MAAVSHNSSSNIGRQRIAGDEIEEERKRGKNMDDEREPERCKGSKEKDI